MYKETATHAAAEARSPFVLTCHTRWHRRTVAGRVFISASFCACRRRRPRGDLSLVLEHTCSFRGRTPWKQPKHP